MLFSRASFPITLIAAAISRSNFVLAIPPRTVTELFDVSFDHTVGGNCAQWGEARLNDMVSDAFDLAQVGLSVVDAATDINNALHNEAFRLLAAWFLTPALSPSQYNQIGNTYQSVYDFLSGSLTRVNAGNSVFRPMLVCGDSWVIRQSMSDQANALDGWGRVVPATDNYGEPLRIQDSLFYASEQRMTTAAKGQETFPYWSSRLNAYIFDRKYGVSDDPTHYYCTDGAISPHAMTKPGRGPNQSVLVLCNSSFRFNGRRLHAVIPACMPASSFTGNRAPAAATTIREINTDTDSLFHEIFHLVLGTLATVPAHGEEYSPIKMLGRQPRPASGSFMTLEEALKNPQTYVLAATGFDYTINYEDPNGNYLEWYTGRCTYQD